MTSVLIFNFFNYSFCSKKRCRNKGFIYILYPAFLNISIYRWLKPENVCLKQEDYIWDQPKLKVARPYLKNKPGMVVHTCASRYLGNEDRRITIWGQPDKRLAWENQEGWAPVAHVCNPSYSGSRDQEDHSLKAAQANSLQDPVLKIPSRLVESGKRETLSSNPSTS
jgi:hypothetical protein